MLLHVPVNYIVVSYGVSFEATKQYIVYLENEIYNNLYQEIVK